MNKSGIGVIQIPSITMIKSRNMDWSEKMYLDPGAGSIIVQAVLAAVLGVGVFTKIFWNKIKSLFGKKESEDSVNSDKE